MQASYSDGYQEIIGGNSESECMERLAALEEVHGEITWYSVVTDEDYESKERRIQRNSMEQRTIVVKPSCFAPEFEMIISVPEDKDTEEYIDELLDGILNEEFRYHVEWDFVDGIS